MKRSGKDDRTRSEAISELFDITKSELPLKTETPASKLDPFVMMETVEYGLTLPNNLPQFLLSDTPEESLRKREEYIKKLSSRRDLSEFHREKHDRRMVGYRRKGRKELETVIASQGQEKVDEFSI